ncbi:carboxypeptidase-like regulatory domain-containing protein [Aeoliella sp. ICT_H6.2]|uniref:Carboxypeptidase-like regulatory domain-containing protein n=1 Tax=Aeoliella straminimaris TaxID=2954799 RepID=A0A9X2FI69_9BACT|nr:carboxypeptidase-like regulatory domain-containing protein [Aeoliella straminimaris]MCO6047569.1 carboxypeptidase-like regulatory domain-containing protein [Aeoliella straminimaris]
MRFAGIGICMDPQGHPIVGANVWLIRKYGPHYFRVVATTTTREDGSYEVEQIEGLLHEYAHDPFLREIQPLSVVVHHPGYAWAIRDKVPAWPACVVMQPSEPLTGVVLDQRGRPVRGANVRAGTAQHIDLLYRTGLVTTRTDERGRYRLELFPRYDRAAKDARLGMGQPGSVHHEPYLLWATASDGSYQRQIIERVPADTAVRLQPGTQVKGRVVNAAGLALPDVGVQLEPSSYPLAPPDSDQLAHHLHYKASDYTQTDADGYYHFDALPAAEFNLYVVPSDENGDGRPDFIPHNDAKVDCEEAQSPIVEVNDLVIGFGRPLRLQLVEEAAGAPLTLERPQLVRVVFNANPRGASQGIMIQSQVWCNTHGQVDCQVPREAGRVLVQMLSVQPETVFRFRRSVQVEVPSVDEHADDSTLEIVVPVPDR